METDGHPAVVEEEATQMMALARANGAREVRAAENEQEGAKLDAAIARSEGLAPVMPR